MKKLFLMSALLLVALAATAQTKIVPEMKKGMKKTYVLEAITNIAGQKPITLTTETQYKVTGATADGYTIDMVMTDMKTDADPNDMMGRVLRLSTETTKGIRMTYATDKDGRITKVLNYKKVRKQIEKGIKKLIDGLQLPKGILTTDALKEQVMSNLTEESLLQSAQTNTNTFALNGKTLETGMQDEFVNAQGMKMKRTYTVNGDGTIQTASTLNLGKEEMKKMVIDQVVKMLPNQAETIKQNIDKILDNVKMEVKENATYTLAADGWIDTIKSKLDSETMSMKTNVQTTIRLKR